MCLMGAENTIATGELARTCDIGGQVLNDIPIGVVLRHVLEFCRGYIHL